MKSNKIIYSIIGAIGVIMLLSICWSLLCFSGAIPTLISPIAYERLNYSNLQALSEIVSLTAKEPSNTEWNWGLVGKYSENVGDMIYELPDKRQYSIYKEPFSDLNIIISGHRRDKLGMIWAITDKGDVIKIAAVLLKN